jgi:peroxiredoxin Q/BCP
MLRTGQIAPDFELLDQNGALVSLDTLVEAGEVMLYFYPADFTPICTAQACAFRDTFEDLASVDVQIVGVSPQSADSHQRFSRQNAIPFPVLVDDQKRVIRAYGVDGPLGFGVRRVTYLIDRTKTVVNRVVSDFFVGSHTDLLNRTLRERSS